MNAKSGSSVASGSRFGSLDFFRGVTMFFLIAESTEIYDHLVDPALKSTIIASIGMQFHHHPWNGLRFWDLIQPFFMFIVGAAMPFSFGRRWDRGDSWGVTFRHALLRSSLLLAFGVGLYCIEPGKLTFELWNVLAQLSFTYLVAFFDDETAGLVSDRLHTPPPRAYRNPLPFLAGAWFRSALHSGP